jgi:hypothetical protein
MKQKLYKNITVEEFENNYWYTSELKQFLKEIGVKNYSKLRKDEIEKIIAEYINHKKVPIIEYNSNDCNDDILGLNNFVKNYKNNKLTKEFIINESLKVNPQLKIKSGSSYWLNRWRENKIKAGLKIKYKDLIEEYVKLNSIIGKLPQIPSTKMNNFIMDYLKNEKGTKRENAMEEWKVLKELGIPKDYSSWKRYKEKNNNIDNL